MKKLNLKDLQLSPKVVTDLTGSPNVSGECTKGNYGTCDTGAECITYNAGTCDTHEEDCHDVTVSCNCATADCPYTQSGGVLCCYASAANASQCCISPPVSNDVCLQTIEDTLCAESDNCQGTDNCPIIDETNACGL